MLAHIRVIGLCDTSQSVVARNSYSCMNPVPLFPIPMPSITHARIPMCRHIFGVPVFIPNAELPDSTGVELIAVLFLHNLPVLHTDR
jgi:hypothetical protein